MLNAIPRDGAAPPPPMATLVGAGTLLDYLGAAVIGVSADGRVRPLNASAGLLLAARRGLAATVGGLAATTAEDTRALRQAVAKVLLDPRRPVALTVGVSDRGGADDQAGDDRRLHLLVTGIGRAEDGADGGGMQAAVLVVEPGTHPRPDPAHLRRWFGLSRREAELAALLAGGEGLIQAAGRLGIAIGTARTHLKRVFAKTGAGSQGRLVSLIRAYPVAPGGGTG